MLALLSRIAGTIHGLTCRVRDGQGEPGRYSWDALQWELSPGYEEGLLKDYAILPQSRVEVEQNGIGAHVLSQLHPDATAELIQQITALKGSLGDWAPSPSVADGVKLLEVAQKHKSAADVEAFPDVIPKVGRDLADLFNHQDVTTTVASSGLLPDPVIGSLSTLSKVLHGEVGLCDDDHVEILGSQVSHKLLAPVGLSNTGRPREPPPITWSNAAVGERSVQLPKGSGGSAFLYGSL